MHWILWIAGYMLATVAELSFLPGFFGTGVPALAAAVLILGIVFLDFWPGLWFAALAGFSRDVLVPGSGGAEAMAALLVFLAVRLFLALDVFDAPLERLSAMTVGILAVPLAANVAALLARIAFGVSVPSFRGQDLLSVVAFRESVFAVAWLLVAAWLTARCYERKRRDALVRLR